MKTKELIKVLSESPDKPIAIMLPDGSFVPSHFHITEIGKIKKEFIDCGGTSREAVSCVLQVWTENDLEHRLSSVKLSKIFSLAESLDLNDLSVEIEYGENTVSQYKLDRVIDGDKFIFVLDVKETNCLAVDKCVKKKCCGKGCH